LAVIRRRPSHLSVTRRNTTAPQTPHLRRGRATHLWPRGAVATIAWRAAPGQQAARQTITYKKIDKLYQRAKYLHPTRRSGAKGAIHKAKQRTFAATPAQEDTMTTQIINKNDAKTDVAQETSKFTVRVVMTMAAVIGAWALACLIGGLASGGFGNLIKGYVSTIIGY
jgi:hypothetical protein